MSITSADASARSESMSADKPRLSTSQIASMSFGFFGIQIAFALQTANISRIFQTLGASIEALPILWVAGPLTGLIVQPIIGYLSDRTWGRFGRRRPYFVIGAIASSIALVLLPNATELWFAVVCFWLLDVAINVSMEPFRAFVGDMLPAAQRTAGYAAQAIFIGFGALLASAAPFVLSNVFGIPLVAADGLVPDGVKLAFYIGAAALFVSVMITVLTTREYSPDQMRAFARGTGAPIVEVGDPSRLLPASKSFAAAIKWSLAGLILIVGATALDLDQGLKLLGALMIAFAVVHLVQAALMSKGKGNNPIGETLGDLANMPEEMRGLAAIQFFSWCALFVMWIYATPVVARHHFGAFDTTSAAYNEAGDWVGILFAVYNAVAGIYAFALPRLGAVIGNHRLHAINLLAGGAGLASFVVIRDPQLLILSMVGVGMAWASILTIPYALLCGALPYAKLGTYMGLFNFFIVIPQLVTAGLLGMVVRQFWPGDPTGVMVLAGAFFATAAAMSWWRARG